MKLPCFARVKKYGPDFILMLETEGRRLPPPIWGAAKWKGIDGMVAQGARAGAVEDAVPQAVAAGINRRPKEDTTQRPLPTSGGIRGRRAQIPVML